MHAATTRAAKLTPNAATPTSGAEPGVDHEVGRTTAPEVAPAAEQPVDAELEPEEEEKEDQPDLGDEVRHLGRLDELDDLRLVRPEEDPREQIGGDRREPEAARGQPQDAEQRDGDGKLGERHGCPLSPSGGHFAYGKVPLRSC